MGGEEGLEDWQDDWTAFEGAVEEEEAEKCRHLAEVAVGEVDRLPRTPGVAEGVAGEGERSVVGEVTGVQGFLLMQLLKAQ